MTYKTKQRDLVLEAIVSYHDSPFTADDLMIKLLNTTPKVSKATIYRSLEIFEKEAVVRKYYISPSESAYYQYAIHQRNCQTHFHAVCYECGQLFHIESESFDELDKEFLENHTFKIDLNRTLLYGVCQQCQGAQS